MANSIQYAKTVSVPSEKIKTNELSGRVRAAFAEYEASADSVKNVYTSKAITNIRKLVTEGYVKVERQSQDVEIAIEEATL